MNNLGTDRKMNSEIFLYLIKRMRSLRILSMMIQIHHWIEKCNARDMMKFRGDIDH